MQHQENHSEKRFGMMAMNYGHVYVAKVAMGANDTQTLRAFLEAEAYDGPSIIIAYSHCIAHGINMAKALENQKAAVDSATGHYSDAIRNVERRERIRLSLILGQQKLNFRNMHIRKQDIRC